MSLRDVFTKVAYKRLVAVDLPHLGSHEHELNGTAALREFFDGPTTEPIEWLLVEDEADPVHESGSVTFYDARAKSFERTGRSEWRLYYTGDFLARADVGDVVALARAGNERLFGFVVRAGSNWAKALPVLLSIEEPQPQLQLVPDESLAAKELDNLGGRLLIELGLEGLIRPSPNDEELVAARFGRSFPESAKLSALARELAPCAECNPDDALVTWLTREEELFRALERVIVADEIRAGFDTVDAFIAYSLTVHNRRKSRAGRALQHHAAAVFQREGLRFTAQATTELNHKPDFLFPGEAEYRDPAYPQGSLTVLAAKSTCKERWRQILAEADRLPVKHLLTRDLFLTEPTLHEMARQGVVVVLPVPDRATYTAPLLEKMLSLTEFVQMVRHQQAT